MRYPVNYITLIRKKTSSHNGDDFGYYSFVHKYQPIYSVADGEVIYKKVQPKGGKCLVIKHKGYCSVYAHLDSWNVNVGDKVKQGKKIGRMGATGKVSGMHLHSSLVKGDKVYFNSKDKYLEPTNYFCVFKGQKVKNNKKTKDAVKYYTKKTTADIWVHNKKDFKKSSRVYSIKKGTEISYYGKSGKYALIDKINGYYCSDNYLK